MSDPDGKQAAIERTERYRSQARAVATLTAAAAGALAAGLVLDDGGSLPFVARLFGLISICFLILATSAFVIASLVHAQLPSTERSWLSSRLRPWESQLESEPDRSTGDSNISGNVAAMVEDDGQLDPVEFRAHSLSVRRRIVRFLDYGMWLSTTAVVSLLVALTSVVWTPADDIEVQVELANGASVGRCPSLGSAFVGTASEAQLLSAAMYVDVEISSSSCAPGINQPVHLLVDRATSTITWLSS